MSLASFSRVIAAHALVGVVTLSLAACSADTPRNPSFDITHAQARAIVADLKSERPRALRPVVVIGGLYDPLNISTAELRDRIGSMLDKRDQPISINVFGAGTTEELRTRVLDRVEAWKPSQDPAQTVEVDIVGFSMGAVVARDAAIARPGQRRLNVRRIFSISGPQQGAAAAELPDLDQRVQAIRPGSDFVRAINAPSRPGEEYELFCYIRLGDKVVGEANGAPPGVNPWWVATGSLERHHGDAHKDPRILADIGLRLAGREGIGTKPETPLPAE